METTERAVRVVGRKTRGYITYSVTLPKEYAEKLGIREGDILHVRIIETKINGKKVKGILYYKP